MILEDNELKDLTSYIPKLLKRDLYKNRKFECCPYCGDIHFIKYGSYDKIQRYQCKKCKKTFSKTTNSLWYYSKKPSTLWVRFIELFLERKSLRECSEILKINIATAFYWRHKIMNLLKNSHKYGINPEKLNGDTFLSCASFQEEALNSIINFKFDPYFKQKKIIIFAARGKEDTMLALPVGRMNNFRSNFKNEILKRIDSKSYIVAWRNTLVGMLISEHNKTLHRKTNHNDDKINNFQLNSQNWFNHFHGISTKYLKDYLAYFIIYNLNKPFKCFEFTYSLLEEFDFIRNDKIKKIELFI